MNELNAVINQLITDVGISLEQAISIFESFFTGNDETGKLLKIYINHMDVKSIQKQAHQIKGTAANLRMDRVRYYAALIESAANECNMELCEQYIINMLDHISILKGQLVLYKKKQRLKILIVEDNYAGGKVLEQIIINLGHQSMGILATPEQALLAVKNELPDLVFMDIDLSSEMNGIYTAELLFGYYSIPIVFVSIHAEESFIRKARKYGIGYVVKPYFPEEIEEMIELAKKSIVPPHQEVNKPEEIKIKIKHDNRIFFLNIYDVIYFEARLHTVLIHTSHEVYELKSSLKNMKSLDVNNHFMQPHRSFLVNKAYIIELLNIDYNYHLKIQLLPDLIPVSRGNVKMIRKIF